MWGEDKGGEVIQPEEKVKEGDLICTFYKLIDGYKEDRVQIFSDTHNERMWGKDHNLQQTNSCHLYLHRRAFDDLWGSSSSPSMTNRACSPIVEGGSYKHMAPFMGDQDQFCNVPCSVISRSEWISLPSLLSLSQGHGCILWTKHSFVSLVHVSRKECSSYWQKNSL